MMDSFQVLNPIISNGVKWYPVEAWISNGYCRKREIVEYFRTKRQAEKYIEDNEEGDE